MIRFFVHCTLAVLFLQSKTAQASFIRRNDGAELQITRQRGTLDSLTGWISQITGLSDPSMRCTCSSCTDAVWNSLAGGLTCGSRVDYLMQQESSMYPSAASACYRVASIEYPAICGACDPSTCDNRTPPLSRDYFCGCESCTLAQWKSDAGDGSGLSCEAHITWLETHESMDEDAACRLVASQFPASPCETACDSVTCKNGSPTQAVTGGPPVQPPTGPPMQAPTRPSVQPPTGQPLVQAPTGPPPVQAPTRAPVQAATGSPVQAATGQPVGAASGGSQGQAATGGTVIQAVTGGSPGQNTFVVLADETLYCYPDLSNRMVYQNSWSDFLLQVKENSVTCGPGDNVFTRNTVSMANNNNELKLQFKYIDGSWKASEVRVVPMNGGTFSYGTYNFSVKSVIVKDSLTDATIANELPPSLVLGLFTWDNTEDYGTHQNWNHEVDIEISQWDQPAINDAQFLVQPAESPSKYRFATGASGTRNQSGHRWQVVWNPGEVHWSTDAGGGQSHSYSTEQAILAGQPDYVQCLPANLEIRMNVWNMYGVSTPTGLLTNNVVEVVIDHFSFTPSGLRYVVDGGYCSKDCQCDRACVDGRCRSE